MKKQWISLLSFFLLSFAVSFGIVYFILDVGKTQPLASSNATDENVSKEQTDTKQEAELTDVKAGGEIFVNKGCIQCHSVDAYNIDAGKVGPDLSAAFLNVPEKHGKELNEFLKDPTSAVMKSVISSNPLTDDERNAIVDALKKISEETEEE